MRKAVFGEPVKAEDIENLLADTGPTNFVRLCGVLIGRATGLSRTLAILVACGNAICGNSAIAAVAPVIGAEREDVAASIALTAVLGVVVVLTLPIAIPLGTFGY